MPITGSSHFGRELFGQGHKQRDTNVVSALQKCMSRKILKIGAGPRSAIGRAPDS